MKRITVLAAAALSLTSVTALTGFAPGAATTKTSPFPFAEKTDRLDRFRQQRVAWAECKDKQLTERGVECAKVTVPLDYREPGGRTLDIAISRIRATDPAKRRGILQTNPGGPGGRGLGTPADLRAFMSAEAAARYDIIGMDTRGLGESGALDCGLTRMSWMRAAGPGPAAFDEAWRLAKQDADACWKKYPDTLPHFSTRNIARDVDLVRSALGERKTSWYGTSYGTVLGATYAQMFPERVDRLVLDSAPDPAEYGIRMFQAMGPANERALDDFAAWAAPRHAAYGLGTTPAAVRATFEELIRRADENPIPIGGVRLDGRMVPFLPYVYGLDEENNAEFAGSLRQILDAADGKPVEANEILRWLLNMMYRPQGSGAEVDLSATLAILCADVSMPRSADWYRDAIERARPAQPVFGPVLNAPVPCAFWEKKPLEKLTRIDNSVPALQIQATGDTRTTYAGGLGMHRAMKGSRLVTVPVRTHGVYLSPHSPCAHRITDDYLVNGTLPARDSTVPADGPCPVR
ncbi:alpha/beta hydrolase [Streptomyces clavuligerus]|nr:alpha/beta hydrolase [Streptomyces clavuligerus]ANW22280.1 transporter [Streptomyces clavuligerus]AXU17175.1 alpha/beta hydrolase [Streptomyces clavuligerus]EDY47657.1 TAP domain-containing protein [Streptomyces clavuligerus]MBY6307179.1 alpha/beta fold hydrolase [Streptomyces clavuligerus]QCS10243.1 alpha/beta hydrolase [Streptomyces clavuligerus]